MGFKFNFDMNDEINYFNTLPPHVKSSAEISVIDVIYESFVVSGDHDYITARLLTHNNLHRGFYWAAAQAIEKYLKAFLLMNGQGVKLKQGGKNSNGHNLVDWWGKANLIDSSLKNTNIHPHPKLLSSIENSSRLKTFSATCFIGILGKHGNPANRYNSFSIDFNTGYLWAFDSLVYKVRNMIGVPPIERSFRRLNADVHNAFKKNNPWFHDGDGVADLPNQNTDIIFTMNTPKLDFISNNLGNVSFRVAYEWLDKKMILPKKAKQ